MTDLELLIKELEDRIENLQEDAAYGRYEPEGVYAQKDIKVLQSQLRLLKQFHPTYKQMLIAEDEKKAKENSELWLDKALGKKLRWLSKKKLSLEAYEKELTKIVKDHMRKLQSLSSNPFMSPIRDLREVNPIDDPIINRTQGSLRQDKIYELTEAMYDGEIEIFELNIIEEYRTNPRGLIIKRKYNHVTIQIKPEASKFQYRSTSTRNKPSLSALGYRKSDDNWLCTLDLTTNSFDQFISIIAITLIEIFNAVDTEIEVIYIEYN